MGTTLADGSGAANHANASGVSLVAGASGLALSLGMAPMVSLVDATSLWSFTEFTISGWFRVRTLPAAGTRMGLMDRNGDYGAFLHPGEGVRCTVNTAGGGTPAGTVVVGRWHHGGITLPAGTARARFRRLITS